MVRRIRILPLAALLLVALLAAPGPRTARADGEPRLESGRALQVRMPRGLRYWIARVEVPADARSLTVRARGSRDVDLYLEHGRASTRRLLAAADAMSRGRAARERVRLAAADGSLRPGTWFVVVENPGCRRFAVDVEVAAQLETGRPADETAAEAEPLLEGGGTLRLALGGGHPVLRRVRVDVPEGTAGFAVEATNDAGADVDLFVRRDARLAAGEEDADYLSLASGPRERLVVGGTGPLPAGTYHLEVVLRDGCGPVRVALTLAFVEPGSGLATWGRGTPDALEPGTFVRGAVASGLPGVRWYGVAVPEGATSLHAQLLESTAPLDLLLLRPADGGLLARAITSRVDERLDHGFRQPPPGRLVLGVVNASANEPRVRYRLAVTFDTPPVPPDDLPWPPVMQTRALEGHERVAAATVEVTVRGDTGGSGTCVTPRGLILTCRHVLETGEGNGSIQRRGILVAFPRHLDLPPVQGFLARVVESDRTLDLALLEITSDVFGRPVRAVAFPALALADVPPSPRLGQALLVSGYPAEASARSRTPVVMTRGTVAGLERRGGALRWVKTDAWIGLGHSGGAVVDERFRLVAIVAATLGPEDGLGLAIPASAVPAAWRRRMAGDGADGRRRPDTD